MIRDAFARAEAEERSGQPGKQVLEGILRALCLGLSPSTPHQALQQLQTFEVLEKTSFGDFLSLVTHCSNQCQGCSSRLSQ